MSGHDDDFRFYPAPHNKSDSILDAVVIIGAAAILGATILSVLL